MTEKEAIKWMEAFKQTYNGYPKESAEACDIAIPALEKIQQYRAIGTVEEAKNQKHNLGVAYKIIDDYQQIGTVEECRAAVEKQKPKRPLGGQDIYGNEYKICRECSAIVEDGEWQAQYCPDCGQALDWNDWNEEE